MIVENPPLHAATSALLGRLASRPWSDDVYLAGSAALALYLGHRKVRDLDLMGAATRLRPPERRDILTDILEIEPKARVETARDGYLYLRLGGAAVRFFHYPYPLVDPLETYAGFSVASAVDLGLMKLGAIISRGTRRDFVDLFLLTRRTPLVSLLDRSAEKFGHVRDFPLQALKGLADRTLARGEPMPELEVALEWSEVEEWVGTEVRAIAREQVGLSGDEE